MSRPLTSWEGPTSPDGGAAYGGPNVLEPKAAPGKEFQCGDAGLDPGPVLARRMTATEYVNTVWAALGIDVSAEAELGLPDDLRADGFGNTAAALIVTLDHVQAYETIAQQAVAQIEDVEGLVGGIAGCAELTTACGANAIEALGLRLYRRPVTSEELVPLVRVFDATLTEGGTFEEGASLLLQAMLQSPAFLYRLESQRGEGPIRDLDPYELASRLSYLVWMGPPDDDLLAAAGSGRLATDVHIESEVRRMLADYRARDTSYRYIRDWLNLDRLDDLPRDPERFPDWDPQLGRDMKEETLALFDYLVWQENRPLTHLFDAQVTFVTRRLAKHYGIEATVQGPEGGMADLSGHDERGGVLTQGSLLTIGGDKASMVGRGLFLLENVLCGELGSPPPGVDTELPEVTPGASQRSFSEQRVADEQCGGCHSQMEPLAWGLERFDATGAYGTVDRFGNELLQDGSIFFPGAEGPVSFGSVGAMMQLLATSERVRDCMSLKAAQFALGRPLVESDACSLAETRERITRSGATYGDVIVAVALSPMFRTIRTD